MSVLCVAQHFSTKVQFHRESTFKTDPTASFSSLALYINSESFSLNQPTFSSEALSSDRNPKMPGLGNKDISGTVDVELSPQMTELLYYTLGAITTTPGVGTYTHKIEVGSIPSFLFEKGFTDVVSYGGVGGTGWFKYNGCKVNSFDMTVGSEGIVKASFNILGAKLTVGATSFDATPEDNGHTPFENAEITIEEGGGSITYVESIKLSINNGLTKKYAMDGTGEPTCIVAGLCKVSGTLTALFRNMTLYTKAINNTESSLKITLLRGTGAGTVGNEKLEFDIQELKYSPKDPNVKGPGPISIELNFEGYYDNGADASNLVITAYNAIDIN